MQSIIKWYPWPEEKPKEDGKYLVCVFYDKFTEYDIFCFHEKYQAFDLPMHLHNKTNPIKYWACLPEVPEEQPKIDHDLTEEIGNN
jgi:hypothetical protein